MKNEECQELEPLGGHLAPEQKILFSLFSRFVDPGIYKTAIVINLVHAEKFILPVQFIVKGTPLIFEPNIRLGFDCGTVFRTEKVRGFPIKITSFGKKSYRLLFVKQKPKVPILPPMVFDIQPPGVTISPGKDATVTILLDASQDAQADELYFVDVMGEDNNRHRCFNFTCTCEVIQPKVIWSKNVVKIERHTERETVCLTNLTSLEIRVRLVVVGSFSLIDKSRNEAGKELNLKLEEKGVRKLYVVVNADEAGAHGVFEVIEGHVNCRANGKPQKTLDLCAKIINPGIQITYPNVTYFVQNFGGYAHISLRNIGSLPAKYSWQHVSKQICPTDCHDDDASYAKTISDIILSLPNEAVPIIPKAIHEPDVCYSDEEPFEDEYSEEGSSLRSSPLSLSNEMSTKTASVVKPIFSNLETSGTMEQSKNNLQIMGKPKQTYAVIGKLTNNSDLELMKVEVKPEPELEIESKPPFVCKRPLQPPEKVEIKIEDIFDYLHLACAKQKKASADLELTGVEDASEQTHRGDGDKKKISVEFQSKKGVILPKTKQKAYIFLPSVPKGNMLLEQFGLEVEGGEKGTLNINVTSLKGRIQVSSTEVDLSSQVWYKFSPCKIHLTNPYPHALKIQVIEGLDKGDMTKQLINGSVLLTSQKTFLLMGEEKASINFDVIMGLCESFIEDIGIEVNNNITGIPIRFRGSGLLPMVIPKGLTAKSLDAVDSFLALQNVYNNFNFKTTSTKWCENTTHEQQDSIISISLTESGTDHMLEKTESSRKLSEFVELNYCDEIGPTAIELERLMETRKFVNKLNECDYLKQMFQQFYCKCTHNNVVDFEPVHNLKLNICRPVPMEISAYVLDMGNIPVNDTKHYTIELTFLGPGKVFLSARTRIVIPGLMAWFDDCCSDCPDSFIFNIQSPEECKQKLYRNMSERDSDACSSTPESSISHPHSFDVNPIGVHIREMKSTAATKIKEHYNKISFPYKVTKNPLILAEVCQVGDVNWHNSTFQLVLLFTALGGNFEEDQIINDFLLIDLHLGPTLPIQLKGCVVRRDTSFT